MTPKKKINTASSKLHVLVCPLDWGLGHATRCIPLIHELILQGCEVLIGAEDGPVKTLLLKEFPQLRFISLHGYKITFSRHPALFSLKILRQLPSVLYNIYAEKKWLNAIITRHKIDAVISDNRPGLFNKKIYAVYITHQLSIKTGNSFSAKMATIFHRYFIKKYDECWVPDFHTNDLAGELSHPPVLPGNVKYIGALSRLNKNIFVENKYQLAIILSGPEPQRTLLENKLLQQLESYPGKTLLLRGLPGNADNIECKNANVEIVNHLDANELSSALQQSDIIISRSGYTTVMDLVKINKKAILVPTPAQAEQEYLAAYLKEKKLFFSVSQKEFILKNALEDFLKFSFDSPSYDMEGYKEIIGGFVSKFSHAQEL